MNTLIVNCITVLIVAIVFIATSHIFLFKILSPFLRQNRKLTYEELFQTVWTTVDSEFEIYENNVFKNGGTPLNNASFKNYYHVISTELVTKFDKDFLIRVTQIMDEESFISFLGALTNTYLSQKLAIAKQDMSDFTKE